MAGVIECVGLTKYYGTTRGVEDLTLEVPQGSVYGFLGPNGAGKTTTIRCLLGILRPTAGEARLLGQRVVLDGARLRARVGYVPGELHLFEKETGRWHIDYVSGLRKAPPTAAAELVERLGFDPSRKVKELSKGNKQKLALVLGLMHSPEVLILDEPTSGLDPLNQETVFEIIEERVKDGATVFLSSHVLSEVERVCDRVGIIRDGRLAAEEGVRDLLEKRLRELTVTFAEPVDPGFFDGVEGLMRLEQRGPAIFNARVKGDHLDEVVKRLATARLADLSIQHASLEEVFMEFYRGDEGVRSSDASGAEGGADA
ncbi:ABC transporter ATP-binding protein [Coriobacteriia bacterium Es71-Z0120]|uniref:ABC transporter ATP-binding protein n=1 Tax=Parvivirga hydrogeniphila TaxID=2939460 RepID=UPI002260BD60|nr:ABC transporter ATP-binding protein [Parvivirga hydrogeniphila]MCL4078660.1 ABC transporter ATP-binding protein [Parvivirga hydrogeniphila]